MTEQLLKQIISLYEHSSALEMEVSVKDLTVKLKRESVNNNIISEKIRLSEPEVDCSIPVLQSNNEAILAVKSPLVGIYYEAKSPGEPPFVKVGDRVMKGQVLAIIEAMKIMNHITAPQDGIVTKIHVKNGDIIEFDQTIIELIIEGEEHEDINS